MYLISCKAAAVVDSFSSPLACEGDMKTTSAELRRGGFLIIYYITFLNPCLRFVGMDKKMLMGLFIAFIMVFSIFGFVIDFAVRPSVSKAEYGDFKFKIVGEQYITKINGKEHVFVFFPGDLEFIQVSDEVRKLLESPVLAVTYNPNSSIAQNLGEAQYYFELQLQDVKAIERALTNNEGTQLSQKSCGDASEAEPVILLQKADESGIVAKDSCIILSAVDPFDLYQQTERIIYTVLGVMK